MQAARPTQSQRGSSDEGCILVDGEVGCNLAPSKAGASNHDNQGVFWKGASPAVPQGPDLLLGDAVQAQDIRLCP